MVGTGRSCSECGEPLSDKRLKANPRAEQCVPCLEIKGDVLPLRRYDEYTPSGDLISTHFTKNKAIERQMRRVNTEPAPDDAFDVALGDDSHLTRERTGENEHAYNMTEAFETEKEEKEFLLEQCRELVNESYT
jgi:hypothetical protein